MSQILDARQLATITATTIRHYDERAQAFWQGTRDHDVSQNRDALLRHIRGEPPLRILDLGCGPGRDLVAFRALGHARAGLDGALRFCEMARALSGCEVLHQDMLALELHNFTEIKLATLKEAYAKFLAEKIDAKPTKNQERPV